MQKLVITYKNDSDVYYGSLEGCMNYISGFGAGYDIKLDEAAMKNPDSKGLDGTIVVKGVSIKISSIEPHFEGHTQNARIFWTIQIDKLRPLIEAYIEDGDGDLDPSAKTTNKLVRKEIKRISVEAYRAIYFRVLDSGDASHIEARDAASIALIAMGRHLDSTLNTVHAEIFISHQYAKAWGESR